MTKVLWAFEAENSYVLMYTTELDHIGLVKVSYGVTSTQAFKCLRSNRGIF